jgi:hypothetical protein
MEHVIFGSRLYVTGCHVTHTAWVLIIVFAQPFWDWRSHAHLALRHIAEPDGMTSALIYPIVWFSGTANTFCVFERQFWPSIYCKRGFARRNASKLCQDEFALNMYLTLGSFFKQPNIYLPQLILCFLRAYEHQYITCIITSNRRNSLSNTHGYMYTHAFFSGIFLLF